MEGFYVFCMAVALVFGAGFLLGRYSPNNDIIDSCNTRHEAVINKTIYQCKPVALLVDGKRAELNQ